MLLGGLLAVEPAATALPHWAADVGRELAPAAVLGPLLGAAAGRAARFAQRRVFIAESFLPLLTLTSTPAVTGYKRRAGTRRAEGGATVAGRLP